MPHLRLNSFSPQHTLPTPSTIQPPPLTSHATSVEATSRTHLRLRLMGVRVSKLEFVLANSSSVGGQRGISSFLAVDRVAGGGRWEGGEAGAVGTCGAGRWVGGVTRAGELDSVRVANPRGGEDRENEEELGGWGGGAGVAEAEAEAEWDATAAMEVGVGPEAGAAGQGRVAAAFAAVAVGSAVTEAAGGASHRSGWGGGGGCGDGNCSGPLCHAISPARRPCKYARLSCAEVDHAVLSELPAALQVDQQRWQ